MGLSRHCEDGGTWCEVVGEQTDCIVDGSFDKARVIRLA